MSDFVAWVFFFLSFIQSFLYSEIQNINNIKIAIYSFMLITLKYYGK